MAGKRILETDRLLLREFDEDDVAAFRRLASEPAITRYTFDLPYADDAAALAGLQARPLADYARYGYGRWACVLKASGAVVGFAGLKYLDDLDFVDLGYRLVPECWGQGLATEASRAVVAHGWERLRLQEIVGLVDPANLASARVLQKLGMTYVDTIEHRGHRADRYVVRAPGTG